ncbi:hypothetical protein [Martelella sp. HB161492]|uniref:hypothetical protein n=1 Tax=Martelella sp. HB161492 TaxID=2720726 RepID=UPI0015903144|nr:hypothetical protein [Martelella sp. HB161492]
MTRKQHSDTPNSAPGDHRRNTFNPLSEAAARLADYARAQGRSRARELVGLLVSQGARAARHAEPPVRIHIYLPEDEQGIRPINLRLR